MQTSLQQQIIKLTKATELKCIRLIQPLWNNYGSLWRIQLNGSPYSSVIVKHVKFPEKQQHPRGFTSSISKERKRFSYQVETTWYQTYNQQLDQATLTPKCLGAFIEEGELLILLEDLQTLGYSEVLSHISWKEMKVVLRWLARFHAHFLDSETEGLWDIGTYWHLETRPEELSNIQGTQLYHFASFIDKRLTKTCYQTIVHGDAKLANFCFTKDHTQVAAVDFQYAGRGCGMKDVAYFVGSCLTDQECQKLEHDILDTYFTELRLFTDHRIDCTKLEAEWRELYPFAWADFQRFMLGWSPHHRKLTTYSSQMTQQVIEDISQQLLHAAQSACLAAGQFIIGKRKDTLQISSKGFSSEASDVVTEVDIKAQQIILNTLAPSISHFDLGWLAEEGEQDDSRLKKHAFWTVDPLDGTQYYLQDQSGYAVSIALVSREGKAILGVVYDPVNQDLYSAIKSKGVTLNGEILPFLPIPKSEPKRLICYADKSLKKSDWLKSFQNQFDLRFEGGAVMNLIGLVTKPDSCYIKPPKKERGGCAIWDIAAGTLILEELQGRAQFYDGTPLELNRPQVYFNDVGLCFTGPHVLLEKIKLYKEII